MPIYSSTDDIITNGIQINTLLNDLYNIHTDNQTIRKKLLTRIEELLNGTELPSTSKSSGLMAISKLFDTYRTVLNDLEDASTKVINTQLKQKETQTNEETAKDVIEFLQRLHKEKQDGISGSSSLDPNVVIATENELHNQIKKRDISVHKNEIKESPYDFNE
jgi:hypothetical protein